MLQQRGGVRRYVWNRHKERRVTVGGDADIGRVHQHWADHGLGAQGDRDPRGGNGTSRRRLHAQEGTTAQVPVRAKRQGVLFVRPFQFVVPDLLHDARQTRHV